MPSSITVLSAGHKQQQFVDVHAMQSNATIKLRRLEKEQQQLCKDPIANALVKRDGMLDFHFVIYGLDGEYKGGFYHGLLQLHDNYPFAAPKLFFYTPSGRFEINVPICTSFTNYHQESWTSAWNVRSLLLGTISFMTSSQASYGCINQSYDMRQQLAQKSLAFNLKNPKFRELFLGQLRQIQPPVAQSILREYSQQQSAHSEPVISTRLQNDPELLLNADQNHGPQNRNENKCRKLIIACGVGIGIALVGLIVYMAAK